MRRTEKYSTRLCSIWKIKPLMMLNIRKSITVYPMMLLMIESTRDLYLLHSVQYSLHYHSNC